EAAICLAYLTTNATQRFQATVAANATGYFDSLLQEISDKLPVRRERLTVPDGSYQYVQNGPDIRVQFSIRVNMTNKKSPENSVPGVVSDLDNMITYKSITTFSSGLTNDLDQTYGFKSSGGLWGDHKGQLIPIFLAFGLNILLYGYSLKNTKHDFEDEEDLPEEKEEDLAGTLNFITGGLLVGAHSGLTTTFTFSDSNSKPEFSIPRKGFDKKSLDLKKYALIAFSLYNSDTNLIVTNITEIFNKDFKATIKYRAFADIFIKNVPQLVIQIIYFRFIVTYSIIPFCTLCSTVIMILITSIQSALEIFGLGMKKKRVDLNGIKKIVDDGNGIFKDGKHMFDEIMDDGKQKFENGKQKFNDGKQKFDDGKQEMMDDGKEKIKSENQI
ncbi:10352_t:CDS:2, partial [Scutellospora calospora]